MIAIPAIDLRDGCCVQLVGGSYDDERVRIANPFDAARRWRDAGFRRLHVVDLDAATERGDNRSIVTQLASLRDLDVQVGGGVRSNGIAERVFAAGARHVVVGTRALDDGEWIAELARTWPGRIIVATDARGGMALTRGWTTTLARRATDAIVQLAALPVAGFLITAVDREGRMAGPDLELVVEAACATDRPVIASGGIASMDDLAALERSGAAAAVIGMALYTGALDPAAVAREFNQ